MITPLEIRQQTFRKVMRGYDREEVHAFLLALSKEWEMQLANERQQKEQLQKITASYETLKEVEDMLHKTLMQAEQSARDTLENARQKAELRLRESELKAKEIVRKGMADRNHLQRELEELTRRREQIISQLHIFLNTQLNHLNGYQMAELPAAHSPTPIQNGEADFFEAKENGSADHALLDDIMQEL
ncbi:MAG: DivIVA domain-containing protein [Bacteroidota bacterium]